MAIKPFTVNADPRNGGTGADNFDGLAGNDTIFGNGGNDTLIGGLGNDSLNGGVDNDTLTGDKGTDTLIGDSGNDVLNGGAENDTLIGDSGNDSLDGGTGADAMTGGDGNDSYWVDNARDTITEKSGVTSGTDTVTSAVNYTLGANLENLILLKTGMTGLKDSSPLTGTGNALKNVITGNAGNNYLDGKGGDDQLLGGAGAGDDTLDGGTGKDTLTGGDGNDTYIVTNTDQDVIVETAKDQDQDVVESSVTYTLGNYLEVLTLTGTAAINGTGNELANTMTGNDAANVLNGYAGNDTLNGGAGDDEIDGGEGDDEIDGGEGHDTVFYQFSKENYDWRPDDEGKWTVEYVGSESDDGVGEGKDSIIGVETFDFAGEKIDIPDSSDDTAPVFAAATVSAKTLVLTYTDDSPLDAENKPAITAFKVTAGGVANAVKTVVVNADAHTVTLTLAKAVTASQTVTITYTDPTAGDDRNAIQDVAGNDAAKLMFNLAPPNQAPVIVPTTYTVSSDTPAGREVARLNTVISDADGKVAKYAITANNTDFDHDGKSAFLLNASTGILTVNDANDLALSTGAFALKVQATDDDGATATGTITVKVTHNQAPVAADDHATADAGASVLIDVLANDSDPDGDSLTISGVSAYNGEVEIVSLDDGNQGISYTSWGSGVADTFNYTISDGKGGTATAAVTVDVMEPIPPNQAPVIADQLISMTTAAGDGEVIGTVAAFDEDGVIVSYAINGGNVDADDDGIEAFALSGETGELMVADADELTGGVVALTVLITDDFEAMAEATVTVEVAEPIPVNEAPIAVDDSAVTDATVTVLIDVLANDSDPEGDLLTILEFSADNGEVGIIDLANGNQGISYTPWESGVTDTINYTISDGNGGTDTAVVMIDIIGPPPAPTYTITAESYEVREGETVNFTISATDVFDGTMLSYLLSGDGIDETDIADGSLDSSVMIYDNYATIAVMLADDQISEGDETLNLTVLDDFGVETTASVIVLDNYYY